MRAAPVLAAALLAASAAGPAPCQNVPGPRPRITLASATSIPVGTTLPEARREATMPHPRRPHPQAVDAPRRTRLDDGQVWVHHALRDWLRLSGPRRFSWGVVGLGTATLSTAIILRVLARTGGDPNGVFANRPDLNLTPGPLGTSCTSLCGLALASGATVFAGGLLQLLTPGHHPAVDAYARAFVATQNGLWVIGVMGSM